MTIATLTVSCSDTTGIVAALSDFVFRHGGNILDADQHTDAGTGRFFLRLCFDISAFALDREGIRLSLEVLARRYAMGWELSYDDHRVRVAVFCSKTEHCLYDLLLRQRLGELNGDIVLVLSNHRDLEPVSRHFDLPFVHIDVDPEDKAAAEVEQQRVLAEHGIGLVVLARYMQILSAEFVAAWPGRIINIHHSFLPAFAGAKPYHQARERGVKIIGATAHYVTADLDQGPIIDQDVTRVSHRDSIADMIRKGRDIERQVLSRAVRYHLDRRVHIDGHRTVIFH